MSGIMNGAPAPKPRPLEQKEAADIAAIVDPAAGGFFRRCLEQAAQLGAELAIRKMVETRK